MSNATQLSPEVIEQANKILAKREKDKAKRIENIRTKYPHADVETLEYDATAKKWSVEIECQHTDEDGNKCGKRRRVYTSDLFQVKFCTEHSKQAREAKRKAKKEQLDRALQAIENGEIS